MIRKSIYAIVPLAILLAAPLVLLRSENRVRPARSPASQATTRSGKPGPSNTGPTNAAALKELKGVVKLDSPGVYENLNVVGQIQIIGPGVVLRNFKVTATAGDTPGIKVWSHGDENRAIIEDGEISAADGVAWVTGVAGQTFTARRLSIVNVHDGMRVGDGTVVENCWIHELGYGGGGHSDGIQAKGEVWPVTIRGNFIDASHVTSAINNVHTNWLIEDNWLHGKHVAIYFNRQATNPKVVNNRFGGEGVAARACPDGGTWERNVRDDTGEAISPIPSAR